MEQYFFRVYIAIFRNKADINHLWYGHHTVLAPTLLEAREKALEETLVVPELTRILSDVENPHLRVYSIVRSRQVYK